MNYPPIENVLRELHKFITCRIYDYLMLLAHLCTVFIIQTQTNIQSTLHFAMPCSDLWLFTIHMGCIRAAINTFLCLVSLGSRFPMVLKATMWNDFNFIIYGFFCNKTDCVFFFDIFMMSGLNYCSSSTQGISLILLWGYIDVSV